MDRMGNPRNPKESILSRMELHKFGIESHTTWGSPDWFFDQQNSYGQLYLSTMKVTHLRLAQTKPHYP